MFPDRYLGTYPPITYIHRLFSPPSFTCSPWAASQQERGGGGGGHHPYLGILKIPFLAVLPQLTLSSGIDWFYLTPPPPHLPKSTKVLVTTDLTYVPTTALTHTHSLTLELLERGKSSTLYNIIIILGHLITIYNKTAHKGGGGEAD